MLNGSHFEDMTPNQYGVHEPGCRGTIRTYRRFSPLPKALSWILSSNGQLREQQDRRWVTEVHPMARRAARLGFRPGDGYA